MWSLSVLWTSLLCALDWMWHTPLASTSPPFLTFEGRGDFLYHQQFVFACYLSLCGLPVGYSHSRFHRHRNVSRRSEVSATCRTAGSSQITTLLLACRSFNTQKQQFERRGEDPVFEMDLHHFSWLTIKRPSQLPLTPHRLSAAHLWAEMDARWINNHFKPLLAFYKNNLLSSFYIFSLVL